MQKTAIAIAHCKKGKGLIKVNGQPIDTIVNETHRLKVCVWRVLCLICAVVAVARSLTCRVLSANLPNKLNLTYTNENM